ncbi:PAS domain-containing sensor histidine kinase [Rhizobium sp. LjRoot258]
MCLDIDDHICAEEARQLTERHLQRVVDALPINIVSWSATGEITHANKRTVEMLGVPDMTFEDFFAATLTLTHPEDVERLRRTVTQGLRTGDAFMVRYRRRAVDGAFRWGDTRFEPRRNLNGAIVEWFGLAIDVDGDVRMQEALSLAQANIARASQAATLAELSASIAHEVAQPLTSVSIMSDTCRRWLSMDPPNIERAQQAAERIQGAAKHASDVVTRIRALFKHSVDGRTTAALSTVIDETCGLLAEETARRGVRIDVEMDDDLPLFAFDRVQIQQVLINLIRNAMQAMEAVIDNRILGIRANRAGEMVQVEISDTGPGVESPEMIFQPFYTTRNEGLGMGLAICRSIVESHHGRLWVEQGNPIGARFVFALPVNKPDAPERDLHGPPGGKAFRIDRAHT